MLAALGASRLRVMQQFFVESLLLSLLAAAVGVAIAALGLRALLALAPADLPRLAHISLDPWVLGFTLAIAIVLAIVFCLLPAFVARGLDVQSALREEGGRGSSGTRARAPNARSNETPDESPRTTTAPGTSFEEIAARTASSIAKSTRAATPRFKSLGKSAL